MSSGKNTASKSSRKGSKTVSSTKPPSLETLTTSLSPVPLKNTRALSTYLQQAFPANHSQWQASRKAKTTKGTSGPKRSNVFAMFDPDTHSWRTSQVCLILDTSAKSSLRWPKQGSMQDGACSEQTMWVPHTDARGSGYWLPAKTPSAADAYTGNMKKDEFKFGNSGSLAQEVESGFLETHRKWPTPAARDWYTPQGERVEKNGVGGYILRKKNKPDNTFGAGLADAVEFEEKKMWPTPKAGQSGMSSKTSGRAIDKSTNLSTQVALAEGLINPETGKLWPTPMAVKEPKGGGQLNPTWVEWLMGWPLGWTDLKPLETDKYQQWLQLHGYC